MTKLDEMIEVAIDVVVENAEEGFPVGISEKGKRILSTLRQAVASKKIYNAEYEDIKFTLSREFEKFATASAGWAGLTKTGNPLLYKFLYYSAAYDTNLRSIDKCTRGLEAFIAKGPDVIPLTGDLANAEAMRRDWDVLVGLAREYMKNIQTWKVVSGLLGQVKPFIVKGRKPVEHPPGYVSPEYHPPAAKVDAIKLVQAKLAEIVEPQ